MSSAAASTNAELRCNTGSCVHLSHLFSHLLDLLRATLDFQILPNPFLPPLFNPTFAYQKRINPFHFPLHKNGTPLGIQTSNSKNKWVTLKAVLHIQRESLIPCQASSNMAQCLFSSAKKKPRPNKRMNHINGCYIICTTVCERYCSKTTK